MDLTSFDKLNIATCAAQRASAAYNREFSTLYRNWLANAYRNYKKDGFVFLPYHGTPDPDFDRWLARIYLRSEVAA
jgi:hypothetical protein